MARESVSRTRAVAAVFLVGMAGTGFLLARCSADRPPSNLTETPTTTAAHRAGEPRAGDSGSTTGDAATEEQVSTAVAYATASQDWLYLSDERLRAAIDAIATPDAAAVLTDEVAGDVAMAREELVASGGRVWWLVRPLAWRVDAQDAGRARISVWTITILSAAGVAVPQSEFVTVTIDLEHLDGAWRVDAVRDEPGPTPVTGPRDQPWDAAAFDEALAGFTRVGSEPQP